MAAQYDKYKKYVKTAITKPPSETDKMLDASLKEYMDKNMPLETPAEMERRDLILADIRQIFRDWVVYVAINVFHWPAEEAQDAGGELFVSGSHRLGVMEPGIDIDIVCVAPHFCSREQFFSSLHEILDKHVHVTNLTCVAAKVPLIAFDYQGVSIDLLLAQLATNTVPADINTESILDDSILNGLDEATEKSLNGPRVTNMIYKLVHNESPTAYPNFLIVLRCVRKWAKSKGIYGNKLGYLGGVNFNILVTLVTQLYPNASPSYLLNRFFFLFGSKNVWKWPLPVKLNHIQENPPNENRTVWTPSPYNIMPIITPAYPAMNSSENVSWSSLEVMTDEMSRANAILQKILLTKSQSPNWGELFEPSDFFVRYSHYLCCSIVGCSDESASLSWTGFVESRIRSMTIYMEDLAVTNIHLYPVGFASKKQKYATCYFIGFSIDQDRLRQDKTIHIEQAVNRFWVDLNRYKGNKAEDMNFNVDCYVWNKLPREVFDSLGGPDNAIAKRRAIRRPDNSSKDISAPSTPAPASSPAPDMTNLLDTSGVDLTGIKRKLVDAVDGEDPACGVDGKDGLNKGRVYSVPHLVPPVQPWQNTRTFTVPSVSWHLLDTSSTTK